MPRPKRLTRRLTIFLDPELLAELEAAKRAKDKLPDAIREAIQIYIRAMKSVRSLEGTRAPDSRA